MNAWEYWKKDIAQKLSAQLDTAVEPSELVVPPDEKLGDLAFGCFRLAKERKTNPAELAKQVAAEFSNETQDLASVSAAGPYVNFTFAIGDAVHRVVRDIETAGDEYGSSDVGGGKQLLLEYAQPNTHKEIHVGHLRNLALGVSLDRILQASGWKVVSMTYHGDVGAHVAKCLWHLAVKNGIDPKELTKEAVEKMLKKIPASDRTGKYLGQMYAESSQALDAQPEKKDEVSYVQQKLEAHDPAWEKLWRETRRWSLQEIVRGFEELGVRIDRQYLESEVVERGQEMVDDLLKKGIAKESQGAIIVDLEDKKLGVFLVRKSDGTSLYATKDLALAELKLKEYPKAARSLILVDNRQMFYFKQLFETLRLLKLEPVPEFIGYEFVTLKGGAMSSREGNVVTFQEFRDTVLDYARGEILKRHDDWSEGKVAHTAWAIALGGIKFGMLKQDNDKVFTFDLEQALAFDGATGPYIQYAATRLGSILRKATTKPKAKAELSRAFDHGSEKILAIKLAQFPSVVEAAATHFRPSLVAQWCLETAQRANDFYRDVPVLESSGDLLNGRLRLVLAMRSVLARGLDLLGIPLPDEM